MEPSAEPIMMICPRYNDCVLRQVRDLMARWEKKGRPVAGIVSETVQCEGGDNFASPSFFQGLQDIAREVRNQWEVGVGGGGWG